MRSNKIGNDVKNHADAAVLKYPLPSKNINKWKLHNTLSMNPQRKGRYQDKLQKFDLYFDQFTKWLASHPIVEMELGEDVHWVYAIIHVFQNLAEICSDLAAMMIKDKGLIPKDNYTNYKILLENEILSQKNYQILNKVNGLRNRVAHEYNGLNYTIAWEAMEEFIDGFENIKEEFGSWLKQS